MRGSSHAQQRPKLVFRFNPKPQHPKYELLAMIRHLTVPKIPPKDVCEDLVRLAEQNMIPRQTPITITFHPKAIWRLMDYHMVKNERDYAIPHPFLVYLSYLDVTHLCIQLPVMDRRLEESLFSSRARRPEPMSWEVSRRQLRDALTNPSEINSHHNMHRFFDLSMIPGQRVTIHNLTLASCDRVVRSLNDSTTHLRIYLRPCAGVDGELFDEVTDQFCYNHPISGNVDLSSGEFRLSRDILDAPQNIEFVDIDWLRGKFDGLRYEKDLEMIKAQVEAQIQEWTAAERRIWRRKSFVTSSQIEGCGCCGRSQLGAREVCQSVPEWLDCMANSPEFYWIYSLKMGRERYQAKLVKVMMRDAT
jgi:hypothetical protein